MSGKNTLVDVEGEIDAGWTSYWGDSDKHGKTVDATARGEDGRDSANLIPSEVDDPESLTERQQRVIEAAVLNQERSTTEIAEVLDMADGNVRNVLSRKVPEWYQNTFKPQGQSQKVGQYDKSKSADPVYTDMTVNEAVDALGGQATGDEVADELGQAKNTVMNKLNDAEGDTLNSHVAVEGYHNRTKVWTLPGQEPVPADEVEELREDDKTGLAELFEAPEDTTEETGEGESGGLEEAFETTEEAEEESGGFKKWEKGNDPEEEETDNILTEEEMDEEFVEAQKELAQLQAEVEQEQAHAEIRTVCEYEAQGDGEAAKLAKYVLERL